MAMRVKSMQMKRTSPKTDAGTHAGRRGMLVVVCAALVLLGGCQSAPKRDPEFAASYPAYRAPKPQANTGGIYQLGHEVLFFEDIKARRIGDVLTIRLTESTNASKAASTAIDKTQNTAISNPTVLGASPQFSLPGRLPLNNTSDLSLTTNLDSNSSFSGDASADQSNTLTGNITVTVADVFPNGNLLVRGEKRLNLNQGNEYVKISGIVRPIDIAADNTVPSTKVADATIVYNGDGAVSDSNEIGWLARFFVSAIFPF